jgi:hypothetical protein
VHFSVVKTWKGKLLTDRFWNVIWLLDDGMAERMGEKHLHGLTGINNFGRKTASIVGVRSYGTRVVVTWGSLIMANMPKNDPCFMKWFSTHITSSN